MSDTLNHVHETTEGAALVEFTPPHLPRVDTPEYHKAHNFLIHQKKAPCQVCGVNIDTLTDPVINLLGSKQMESHHYPIERSLMNACDPVKVHTDFPVVYDKATLEVFIDSPQNLIILCDVHHRSPERGIHHLLTQDFVIQKYLYQGYMVAGTVKDAATILAADEALEQRLHLELGETNA